MGAPAEKRAPVLPPEEGSGPSFSQTLRDHGLGQLLRGQVKTLQVNVGTLCNMACHHCHVEAGPKRTEMMSREVAERVVELVAANPGVETVDLTGGAPELNPNFRWLVTKIHELGREVLDRCNLTILFEPRMHDLPEFLAAHEVHVVASLPCYQAENVEQQRGRGVFDKSIEALKWLNSLGYGRPQSGLALDLVYNPVGASLPPPQSRLEAKYKEELGRLFGIEFQQLLTLTNMPIKRFARLLERTGQHEAYMGLLVNHFNPDTVGALMCRSLLSVGWDGQLYDCDFNIAIGADTPGLPERLLLQARDELTRADAVLGPSDDGGFYLAGFNRCPQGLFDDLPWSERTTFSATRARIEARGITVRTLEPWFDVDQVEDLERLRGSIELGEVHAPATHRLLTASPKAAVTCG